MSFVSKVLNWFANRRDKVHCRGETNTLTWEEFSPDHWFGLGDGTLVVTVNPVPGNRWFVLPDPDSYFFCDSLREAKTAAEMWYRNHSNATGSRRLDSGEGSL